MLSREIKFKLRFVAPVKLCFGRLKVCCKPIGGEFKVCCKPIGSEFKVCCGKLRFVS